MTSTNDSSSAGPANPPAINYVLGFLLVGLAWGLTTPFIRKAAKSHNPPPHPVLESDAVKRSWLRSKVYGGFFAVVDLLRNPRYAVPLLLNLTGSVWFFLLVGQAGKLLQGIFRELPVFHREDILLYRERNRGQLLITRGGAELSLTVPIVNSLAFLFTVIGEWWVEGKVISRGSCPLSQSRPCEVWRFPVAHSFRV